METIRKEVKQDLPQKYFLLLHWLESILFENNIRVINVFGRELISASFDINISSIGQTERAQLVSPDSPLLVFLDHNLFSIGKMVKRVRVFVFLISH